MNTPLIIPAVSEKAFAMAERGTYVFDVPPKANKTTIKQAVEQGFGVTVVAVRTLRRKGKTIRSRTRKNSTEGQRAEMKKAYVTLAPGQTITMFED